MSFDSRNLTKSFKKDKQLLLRIELKLPSRSGTSTCDTYHALLNRLGFPSKSSRTIAVVVGLSRMVVCRLQALRVRKLRTMSQRAHDHSTNTFLRRRMTIITGAACIRVGSESMDLRLLTTSLQLSLEIPLVLFHASVSFCISRQISRKQSFNSGFYVLYLSQSVADVVNYAMVSGNRFYFLAPGRKMQPPKFSPFLYFDCQHEEYWSVHCSNTQPALLQPSLWATRRYFNSSLI